MKKKEYMKIILIGVIILPIVIFLLYKSLSVSNPQLANEENDEFLQQDIWALDTTKDYNLNTIINSGYPAIIDVGGSNCYACVKMRPVLEELNKEYQGRIIVNFIDLTKNYELTSQFDTYILPTQYFYYANGELYKKHVGALTKEEILEFIEEMNIDI